MEINGRLVRDIGYHRGIPILDKHAIAGHTVSVVLTGDSQMDIRNAKMAWQKLNPGKKFPDDTIFHHDLLHVAEETTKINGKKTKVLVGKMHLVPRDLHKTVFHEGSASVARKFYQGLGTDVNAIKGLALAEAKNAGKAGSLVSRAASKILPRKLIKGVLPFVGRSVVRALPLIGTGISLLEFPENVQAHGLVGAAARATPVLGDLLAAHGLGSELAKQIRDEANAAADAHLRELNKPVADAWQKATEQMLQAYNDLAPNIRVTNNYGPNGLVDAREISEALQAYRAEMQHANLLKAHNASGFNFAKAAKDAKQRLADRLTAACQRNAAAPHRPAL